MRLIDADELTKQLETMANDEWNIQVGASRGLEDAIDVIDNAPTADDWQKFSDELWKNAYERGKQDARTTGEWVEKIETKQLGHGWLTSHEIVCSICGGSGENDENIPQCWKFCPNCGAKMQKSE